jgi:hypothetical protein
MVHVHLSLGLIRLALNELYVEAASLWWRLLKANGPDLKLGPLGVILAVCDNGIA